MRPLIFSLLCLFLQFTSFAQTSLGTQFWLAYMENLTLEFNDAPRFAVQGQEQRFQGTLTLIR